jgi:cellulose synthase/poly-beta-1,6-N-acetylglucosamine synthase-like glycosyltransferase
MIIGICAYNEEGNIGNLLHNLVSEQNLPKDYLILVVCSGCTDNTPKIVIDFSKREKRIKLVTEKFRKGKASALNKIFRFARKSAEVLVLVNADALPKPGSIASLICKLENDDNVGAVFAQPVPIKLSEGVCHKIVCVIWRLHHLISLNQEPKLSGELCAIRASSLCEIPENVATDEPYIEFYIRKQGYKIHYEPKALVYIRCPTNLSDLLKQRRRIWVGHMQFKSVTQRQVSTSNPKHIMKVIPKLKISEVFYLFLGGFIELFAYVQAKAAFRKRIFPYAWEPIKSTKTQLKLNFRRVLSDAYFASYA